MALTTSRARAVVAAAENRAREMGVAVVIAVLDSGVHLKEFSRMDGAPLGSIDIAVKKARTAALFGTNSESSVGVLQAWRSRARPRADQRWPGTVRRRHPAEGRRRDWPARSECRAAPSRRTSRSRRPLPPRWLAIQLTHNASALHI